MSKEICKNCEHFKQLEVGMGVCSRIIPGYTLVVRPHEKNACFTEKKGEKK